MDTTDRIEKRIFLRAPQEKVWQAISDAEQFGNWFGIEFDSGFSRETEVTGRIKPTSVDPALAKMQENYRGKPVAFVVERIEPMSLFSFRWHPFANDESIDYSKEPATLVVFTLEPAEGGTMLTIVESGFNDIPIARRADAFEANEKGWGMQLQLIEKYLQLK